MRIIEFFASKYACIEEFPRDENGLNVRETDKRAVGRNGEWLDDLSYSEHAHIYDKDKYFRLSKLSEFISPLEDPNLWSQFTKKNANDKYILKLAKKYGYLYDIQQTEARTSDWDSIYMESIAEWRWEMNFLHLAESMWQALLNEDLEEAKKLLPDRSNRQMLWRAFYGPGILHFAIVDKPTYASLQKQYVENLTIEILWGYLLSLVQEKMSNPGLGFVGGDSIALWSYKERNFAIRPSCLASAIWVQFAQVISSGNLHSMCKNAKCGRIFATGHLLPERELGKKKQYRSHSDRLYCSKACKQAAWRNSPEQRAKRKPKIVTTASQPHPEVDG